jgi:glycosyltransferase involved in cell wall biosynthesis
MCTSRKKIAFIHRYGLEGWVCCGGHAVPGIIEQLANNAEIHFFGPKTTEIHTQELRSKLVMHELPHTWNRANPSDKITKTLLWYLWLPIIGIHCRIAGIRLIWNDETVPFTAPILRLFFGKNVAITVMDFFARIYTEGHPRLHWIRNLVEKIDFAAWKKLPVIFTKVLYTQEFLAERGVPKEVMHLYRNPVDHAKFHPVDEVTRTATREKFGFIDNDIVLSHHGILHPNKGNDWIFHRLKELKDELPNLKYLLIGNGPEMDTLKKLAAELNLTDRIIFTGWLPTEKDLNNALASADIGLVMRIGQDTDHFHMTDTLAHEMACAKPILAVDLKGIAEVIHDDQNGFLFSTDDPEEFRHKLTALYHSAPTRSAFSKSSIVTSKSVSSVDSIIEKMATTLLNAYV